MSIGVLQERQSSAGAGFVSSVSLAFTSNVTAGSACHAIGAHGSVTVTETFSDNNSNTWPGGVLDRVQDTVGGLWFYQQSTQNMNAGATTVTTSFSATRNFPCLWLKEIGGAATTGSPDGHNSVTNASTTSQNLTANNANVPALVSVLSCNANTQEVPSLDGTYTASSANPGWNFGGGISSTIAGHKRVTSGTTQSVTNTQASADALTTLMMVFDELQTGTTITPTQGAGTFAGLAAVMALGMTPAVGAAAFQGYAPTVSQKSPDLAPSPGTASFLGYSPGLNLTMTPAVGALTAAGQASNFFVTSGRTITPASGTLSFTGAAAIQGLGNSTGSGSGAWQGYAPTVSLGTSGGAITPNQADMTLTGYAVSQTLTLSPPAQGVLSFQGYAPFLGGNIIAVPPQAALSFQGYAPILGISPQTGALSFQGQSSPLAQTIGGGTPGALAFTGLAPVLSLSGLTVTGTLSFTGLAPTVTNQFTRIPGTGALNFTGNLSPSSFLSTGVGSAAWTGYAPTLTNSGAHPITTRHFMQRFPVGTDGTVQCVDFSRAVAPFVFWQENKVDANGLLCVVVDGVPTGWDDGLQVNASECLILTRNPVAPVSWTNGLQIDARGFLIVTDNPTLPVFNMQGLQFDVNGYLVVTIS